MRRRSDPVRWGLFAMLVGAIAALPFLATCAFSEKSPSDETTLPGLSRQGPPAIQTLPDGDLAIRFFAPPRQARIDRDGVWFAFAHESGGWSWHLAVTGLGRATAFAAPNHAAPEVGPCQTRIGPGHQSRCAVLDRGDWLEEYAPVPNGLKQGFVIFTRPPGNGPLVIDGEVTTTLNARFEPQHGRILFTLEGRTVLRYSGLRVLDANDEKLNASIRFDGGALALIVNDRDAIYPIRIDPFITGATESWVHRYNGSGNGNDYAFAVALDDQGSAFVAGFTYDGLIDQDDVIALKILEDGTEDWVATYQGTANDEDKAADVALDAGGNVYVTGYATNTSTGRDLVLIKYANNGAFGWARTFTLPGAYQDEGRAVGLDGQGNIYVTGLSENAMGLDFITVKYDGLGQKLWDRRYDGPISGQDVADALVVNPDGGVWVTGPSEGNGTGFDYASVRYSAAGTPLWSKRYDGPAGDEDQPTAIVRDSLNNVFVTGFSTGSGGYLDFATVKYSALGTENWVTRFDGRAGYDDLARALAVDADENIYVVGYQFVTEFTDADFAVVSYDNAGDERWRTAYDGPQVDSLDEATDIVIGTDGRIFVTGFSQGLGTGYDFTTLELDAQGNRPWSARYDGIGSGTDVPNALALDNDGNVVVTGYTYTGLVVENDLTTVKYCVGCQIGTDCFALGQTQPGNPCLICDVAQSTSSWSDNDGAFCDDGFFCTGADYCLEGACAVHTGNPCDDDGLFCNGDEVCDEDGDDCDHSGDPCPDDGLFCNGGDYCDEVGNDCDHTGDPCDDDGLFCNGDEFCDETNDVCTHAGDPCDDDGLYCNGDEICDEGGDACDHTGDPCGDDGSFCNGDESCDETNDACDHSGDPCDDDGLFCNGDELCDETHDACAHAGDPCGDDGLFCNGAESCDETAGACVSEGNPCAFHETCNEADDACDPIGDDDDANGELTSDNYSGGSCGC